MTTPADYREFARDCMRSAEGAENAAMRETMMGLARIWMRTALEVEQGVALAGDGAAAPGELRTKPN